MKDSRQARLAPLTGAISVVLVMIGAGIFGVYDYLPPADRLQGIFGDNPTRVFLAGRIGTI